jgi:hypothetical protein
MTKITLGSLRGLLEAGTGLPGPALAAVGRRLSTGAVGAAITRLRGPERPLAPTLADNGEQIRPRREADPEEVIVLRLADHRHTLPPICGPGEKEIAARVERAAEATWDAWCEGTPAPRWHDLSRGIKARMRAAARAGLIAAGTLPPARH